MRKQQPVQREAASPSTPRAAAVVTTPREAREAAGLSREELAARAGCSYGTVRDCETLGRWPRNIALRRSYLAALGLGGAA